MCRLMLRHRVDARVGVQPVGHRRSGRLVDTPQHVEVGEYLPVRTEGRVMRRQTRSAMHGSAIDLVLKRRQL